ncbi:hypothetical protein NC653_015724 [Populus alba x Populus x berolinensis]|uniref:Uncharacterized protein n=1 Tax=Populus alba x Populus x berolinensis TaxID=444605 RepID=A0AAD6QLJ7_9ROSI|nr:hypothetical protein NC653_015724 [Populus alba x Populus x berolinensis]
MDKFENAAHIPCKIKASILGKLARYSITQCHASVRNLAQIKIAHKHILSSELRVGNEDGISILFYLQKIFPAENLFFPPDEWENFLERIGRAESTGDADLQENSSDSLELRIWASYRGQTLARTD